MNTLTTSAGKRLDEQFPLDPRDPIRSELRNFMSTLEARLQGLEILQTNYDAIVEEARTTGLNRINDTLTPIIQSALDKLSNVTNLFVTTSTSSLLIEIAQKSIYINWDDKGTFVPLDFVMVTQTSNPGVNWMFGQALSLDRTNGLLVVNVLTKAGSGTIADWTITGSPPLDVGHAARTDNPHLVTAAQVGAYTIAATDTAISSALAALRGGVSAAYDTLSEIAAWIATADASITARLRIDAPGSYTSTQQVQARSNLGFTTVGGDIVQAVDAATVARLLGLRPRQNFMINSAMMVDQEFQGNLVSAVTSGFIVDKMYLATSSDAVFSHQRVLALTPGGSPRRARVSVTTLDSSIGAAQYAYVRTVIEGIDAAPLRFGNASARTLLVRIGVKPPMAGNFYIRFSNAAGNRNYVHKLNFLVSDIGTDVVRYFTIPGDTTGTWATDNTAGLKMDFILAAGTTLFTVNQDLWEAGAFYSMSDQNNGLIVTQAWEFFDWAVYDGTGIEAGNTPEFEVPNYTMTKRLCMRYYETSFNEGFAWGSTVAGGATDFHGAARAGVGTSGISSLYFYDTIVFKVQKRVRPTMLTQSPFNTSQAYSPAAGNTTMTLYPEEAAFGYAPAAQTNESIVYFHWRADCRLT